MAATIARLMPETWPRRIVVLVNDAEGGVLLRKQLVLAAIKLHTMPEALFDGKLPPETAAAVKVLFPRSQDARFVGGQMTTLLKAGIFGNKIRAVLLAEPLRVARCTLSWLGCQNGEEAATLLRDAKTIQHRDRFPVCVVCRSKVGMVRVAETEGAIDVACPDCANRYHPSWKVLHSELPQDVRDPRADILMCLDDAVPGGVRPVTGEDLVLASKAAAVPAAKFSSTLVPAADITQSRAYQHSCSEARFQRLTKRDDADEASRKASAKAVQQKRAYSQWPPGQVPEDFDTDKYRDACASVKLLSVCEDSATALHRSEIGTAVDAVGDITLALVTPEVATHRTGTSLHFDMAGAVNCATSISGQSVAGDGVLARWGFVSPLHAEDTLATIEERLGCQPETLFARELSVSQFAEVWDALKEDNLIEEIEQKQADVVFVAPGCAHITLNDADSASMKVARELCSPAELEGAVWGRCRVRAGLRGYNLSTAAKLPEEYVSLGGMLEDEWKGLRVLFDFLSKASSA